MITRFDSKARALVLALLSFLSVPGLFGQSPDPVILSYQRNFIRASMSTKIELLGDATRITTINMVPLFNDAFDFVLQYRPVLGNDSQLVDLAVMAASKCGQWNDPSILPKVLKTFLEYPDSRVRIACLDTFASLSPGKAEDIKPLNDWFASQLSAAPSGGDSATLIACAKTLGKIGSGTSFSVLFKAATSPLDSGLVLASKKAINSLKDGYADQILGIFASRKLQDSYAAFALSRERADLPTETRGTIAQSAFSLALESVATAKGTEAQTVKNLLAESLEALTELSWSPSSPEVVKYFYQVQGDYKNGNADVSALIPVIRAMGSLGTTESAQALSIFLGLLNSETEQKKTYNEQLMLAIIKALGDLGDKTAFDYLLYVGYLDYPETVKKASRDALARLQW